MQEAKIVLSILSQKSVQHSEFVFRRLYRHFFYKNFYAMPSKNKIIRFQLEEGLETLIGDLKKEKLNFSDYHKEWILLLQGTVTKLFEAIYKPLWMKKLREEKEINESGHINKKNRFHNDWAYKNWFLKWSLPPKEMASTSEEFLQVIKRKIEDGRLIYLVENLLKYFKNHGKEYEEESVFKEWNLFVNQVLLYDMQKEIERKNLCQKMEFSIFETEMLMGLEVNSALKEAITQELEHMAKERFLHTGIHWEVKVYHAKDVDIRIQDYQIQKSSNGKIALLMPHAVLNEKLHPYLKNGKVVHYKNRVHLPVERIVHLFEKELKQMEMEFSMCENYSKRMKKFKYYHRLCLLKTLSRKENSTVKKVLKKYNEIFNEKT
jgi:aspartate carbamoyltransferase regulatory subunit